MSHFYFNKQAIHEDIDIRLEAQMKDKESSLNKAFNESIKSRLENVKDHNDLINAIYNSLLEVNRLSIHIAVDEMLNALEKLK